MSVSRDPHDYDHRHADVAGGWLRATVFGGMDGLVSNIGLISGVGAAGAPPGVIALTGVAGLVAGAFSMALGEFTSVRTQNEQVESEVAVERQAQQRNPDGEREELVGMFMRMGMSEQTARAAVEEVHTDDDIALRVHVTQELGVDPVWRPSPWTAAISSFLAFAVGAIIPVVPYLFGATTLWWGLATGGAGLLVAGGLAARVTRRPIWFASLRQFLLGAIAVAASFSVGLLFGVSADG